MTQFFTQRSDIEAWLDRHHIKEYTILDNLSVDVKNNVSLQSCSIKRLPVQFNRVNGSFLIGLNGLVSLQGVPKLVGENFNCVHNALTSLAYAPEVVGGDFFCGFSHLTSLSGLNLTDFDGDFECQQNSLINLQHAPSKARNFDCSDNKITSLYGAPEHVKGDFLCNANQLVDLTGSPQTVGQNYDCSHNSLTSLLGSSGTSVGYNFVCSHNKILDLCHCPERVGGKFSCTNNPGLGDTQFIYRFQKIKEVHEQHRAILQDKMLLEKSTLHVPNSLDQCDIIDTSKTYRDALRTKNHKI